MDIHQDKILILDFGSQYTQLIARRVREAGVYSEIHHFDVSEAFINQFKPKGIILSGGPDTVLGNETPRIPEGVFNQACPVLGICYGMQAMAKQLGGVVESAAKREFGHAFIKVVAPNALLEGIQDTIVEGEAQLDVWMSHGDHVVQKPESFTVIAESSNAPIAAIADEHRQWYGLQFHPEVTHTQQGQAIIERFVHQICGCGSAWTAKNIIESAIENIRQQVGQDEVLLGLSGGVDSSVVAALLHKAIGKQLTCVFVDHGLLRLNEAEQVMQTFREHMGVKVIKVDAKDLFYAKLKGESCPEKKRKIIGNAFIEVFEQEAAKLTNIKWLAQGTIYPDVIESAGTKMGTAKVIKSHHNVGGLPADMQLNLLEPIRELFKDEVRLIGLSLGLAPELIYRHPFPGPGLGVRILGEIKPEYVAILQKVDAVFVELLREYDYYHKVSQAFAVFLPVKSVGVMGDDRKYEYVVALRAVETIDFMTARWAHLPYELLAKASSRIINEVAGISRVTYDISGKPPATIEWE